MVWFHNLPIRRKVTLVILLASTTALLAACAAFVRYEMLSSRRLLARDLTVLADVIGRNSTAALKFNDSTAAANILQALQAKPHVTGACLYLADGQPFAKYVRPGTQVLLPTRADAQQHQIPRNLLAVFCPIVFERKTIGTVCLESDLTEIDDRIRSFVKIAGMVLLGSMALTTAISFWLQRLISQPILDLAKTAQLIRENRDYSVRAQERGQDEIGLLTSSFNEMLVQIQIQNDSLRRAHDHLDRRVREVSDLKAALDEHAIVAITDPRGKITYVNDKFCAISKYSREELLGQDHRIINSGHHPKEFMRGLWITIAQGRVWHGEIKNKAKDGSYYWVDATIVPFLNEKGKPHQYVAIRTDITARKLAEEEVRKLNAELEQRVDARTAELAAANKELEAFSYSVSHDLRAPLRSLDGFSQALLEDYGDKLDATGKDLLKRIRQASARMDRLIEDLLNLSRVSRSELHRESVNLSGLAKDVLDELQRRDPQRHVDLRVAGDLKAEGDPRLLRVMLENLLGNAWKYTTRQPQATIEFGANGENGHASFFVRDDGVGFDMQYAGKLFAPFQRLHGMKEFPGTGIGLATVQRIVHRHGGHVWAQADVNKGATFYFTLS
jgi:PAS domain S-box-containing protein